MKQISWHKIDTHPLWRSHTKVRVPQQNQTDFVARNQHSPPVEIARRSAGPSAKSNRFSSTKLTLTSCGDHIPKRRSFSNIKDFVARNQYSRTVEITHRSADPSAKTNRFRGTKLTLTDCQYHTPKDRSLSKTNRVLVKTSTPTCCRHCTPKCRFLSKIKQNSQHKIDTHSL